MRTAAQESLLPGTTDHARFEAAHALGLEGVEVLVGPGFESRLESIAAASAATRVPVAALNVGHTTLIHPDPRQREAALTLLREAMSWSVDLNASGVIFMGHYAPQHVLPDLHPYKSAQELEAELLIRQLSATLCDFAHAIGAHLMLEHASSRDTVLLSRAAYARTIHQKLNQHPNLHVAANVYHMLAEGDSPAEVLPLLGDCLHGLHLSGADHSLDLAGVDLLGIVTALRAAGFAGWITLESASRDTDRLGDAVRAVRAAL